MMVAHAIVRPLTGVIPLHTFNPGEEKVMIRKAINVEEEPKTTACVSSSDVSFSGIGYGHEGWKEH